MPFIRNNLKFIDKCFSFTKNYELKKTTLNGVPVEIIQPKGEIKPQRYILYFHGGAFIIGLNQLYRSFSVLLAQFCKASVMLADYSLAPENPFPIALNESLAAYKALLEFLNIDPKQIIIGGDSAGGNLAIALLLACKEEGIPMPSCAFIFSGWFDLTLTGESIEKNKMIDPVISPNHLAPAVSAYLKEKIDATHPLISPLYGDLTGLPPLFLHVGQKEILLDDTLSFAKKAEAQGAKVKLVLSKNMVHVHPILFQHDQQSIEIIKEISLFIASH